MKSATKPKENSKEELSLFDVCEKGKAQRVQELLSAGVSPNVRDQRGNWLGATPLMYATKSNQIECVKILLAAGANPDLAESPIPLGGGRRRPLHIAVQNGHREIVALLVKAGADVNAVSQESTVLASAVSRGDLKIAELLLHAGANPNLFSKSDGINSLHAACMFRKNRLVPLLLDAGADVNAQDNTGQTALMSAALERQAEIVEELLKRGAKVNLHGMDGITALMWAVIGGREDLVALLLKTKPEINAKTPEGLTALDYAIRDRKKKIQPLLVKAGGKSGK